MGQIVLHLPFPPSVNTYYAVVRNRKILSKKGREYKKQCASVIQEQGFTGKGIDGDVQVYVSHFPPDKRSRDIDNYCKALLDAITNSGVWIDDSQIKRLTINMGYPCKGGSSRVEICY